MINKQRMYDNATMIKALQDVDEDKAIEALSNINLDSEELVEFLDCVFMNRIVNKKTGEPIQFSSRVKMAAVRNRIEQIDREERRKGNV